MRLSIAPTLTASGTQAQRSPPSQSGLGFWSGVAYSRPFMMPFQYMAGRARALN